MAVAGAACFLDLDRRSALSLSLCPCRLRHYPPLPLAPQPDVHLLLGLRLHSRRRFLYPHRLVAIVPTSKPSSASFPFAFSSGDDALEEEKTVAAVQQQQQQQGDQQLMKRVILGLGIGLGGGGVVVAGGWVFALAVAAAVLAAAREYFELVRSRGIAKGMRPPPRYVSRVCSVICALMPLCTL